MRLLDLVLGRRLANREYQHRKIGALEGVPAMGLDAIGSCAYGPEAALAILIPLGAGVSSWIGWVMVPVVGLLVVLFASYWQTIHAYPNNGGGYLVSRENLGTHASLLAAAALMIDYVLNVAVGISAGVGALVSAVPALQPHILACCLAILALITLANLRGTPDAGRLFAVPTYLFIGSYALVICLGLGELWRSGGHPHPIVPPPQLPAAVGTVSVWLLLRSFASGCTAMTGVEAVSNGMSAFREPTTRYGARTLTTIVAVLGLFLVGISWLVVSYRIGAMDQSQPGYRSVLSQLASAVAGQGSLYYIAIGSLTAVLALSANTSFVDFPRLCRMVAGDRFLPKSFAIAGHRLVYSVGILYLAGCAGLLLFAFGGVTDALIPLFAIGAFLTFTLSQAGMVVHWRRAHPDRRGRRAQVAVNLLGAVTTGVALVVIVITKFTAGAWITVLIIPCVIVLLKTIRGYYDRLDRQVRERTRLAIHETRPPVVLVVIERWNKLTDQALNLALSLSPDVMAVHLTQLAGPEVEEQGRALRERWESDVVNPARAAGLSAPGLVILQAQYRAIGEAVVRYLRVLENDYPRRRIAVLVPEVVRQHWYQYVLHAGRARSLMRHLLQHGGGHVFVISLPWYLYPPTPEPTRPREPLTRTGTAP